MAVSHRSRRVRVETRGLALVVGGAAALIACGSGPATTATTTSGAPVTLATIDGCPTDRPGEWEPGSSGSADYIDFVQLDGRMYEVSFPRYAGTDQNRLERRQLDGQVGLVCFTFDDISRDLEDPIIDGDAAFLSRGTTLHAISGSDPRFRLAAVQPDGMTNVYEVADLDGARTGGELLDFSGGVDQIVIRSEADIPVTTAGGSTMPRYGEEPRVGTIDDPELIRRLLDDLATAPVSSSRLDDGPSLIIDFQRPDGTVTRRRYWPRSGALWWNIELPPSWTAAIDEATGA